MDRLYRALERVENDPSRLTAEECQEVRNALVFIRKVGVFWGMLQAFGKVGKQIIWLIISLGAVAAVLRSSGFLAWVSEWLSK